MGNMMQAVKLLVLLILAVVVEVALHLLLQMLALEVQA
jgi:hypothetical protein